MQEELDRLLEQTQEDISRLPNPPSSEPISEILKLIGDFVQSTKNLVDGIIPGENHDGLIQTLRGPRDEFKKAIRQTAPFFIPLERSQVDDTSMPAARFFLSSEEAEWEDEPCHVTSPIFVDDVLERANS